MCHLSSLCLSACDRWEVTGRVFVEFDIFESLTTVCRHLNCARVCRVYVSKLVQPTISSGVQNIHEFYRSHLLLIIIKRRFLPREFANILVCNATCYGNILENSLSLLCFVDGYRVAEFSNLHSSSVPKKNCFIVLFDSENEDSTTHRNATGTTNST